MLSQSSDLVSITFLPLRSVTIIVAFSIEFLVRIANVPLDRLGKTEKGIKLCVSIFYAAIVKAVEVET